MVKKDIEEPRILMVLPTLGQRPDYLKLTLESLNDQKEVLFDLVMIFPLNNVETMALAKKYNAITVEDPGSISKAVNAGIAHAKSHHEYIGWIGDDDFITPNSLEIATKLLDADNSAVLAYGYCDYIDEHGNKLFSSRAGKLAPWLMTWGPNLVPCPGAVFRKKAIDQVGGFDENNKYSMDLDILLKLRKTGKFINTKTTLAAFRWHSTSQTVNNREAVLNESEQVKRIYLSKPLQKIAPVWEPLVRIATKIAANQVDKKVKKIKKQQKV